MFAASRFSKKPEGRGVPPRVLFGPLDPKALPTLVVPG